MKMSLRPSGKRWGSLSLRQHSVIKIDEAIINCGVPTSKTAIEMENIFFTRANTKDEYLGYVCRGIRHVRELSRTNNTNGRLSGQNWRTPHLRQHIVNKISDAITNYGAPTSQSAQEMENIFCSKASSKDEYFTFVARGICHIMEMATNPDLIANLRTQRQANNNNNSHHNNQNNPVTNSNSSNYLKQSESEQEALNKLVDLM